MNIVIIIGFIGLVGIASLGLSLVILPFALFRGYKHKKWKLGKIAVRMFFGGLAVAAFSLIAEMFIAGLSE